MVIGLNQQIVRRQDKPGMFPGLSFALQNYGSNGCVYDHAYDPYHVCDRVHGHNRGGYHLQQMIPVRQVSRHGRDCNQGHGCADAQFHRCGCGLTRLNRRMPARIELWV